jgi:lipid A oxidase
MRLAILFLVAACALPARAQWEFAGYIGAAHTQTSHLHFQQPATVTDLEFHPVAYRGESFSPPLYYGARGGYFFNRWLGLDIEYTHLKAFSKTAEPVTINGSLLGAPISVQEPMNAIVQRYSISHGVNLLLANLALRQALAKRLVLLGHIGGGATIPHPEAQILGIQDQHYQVGSPAFQLAGGAEFQIWRGLNWMAEYKYTHCDERVQILSGNAATLLDSHHLITGLALRLGRQ